MNYIFYLKKQVINYMFIALGASIGYPIGRYFGWREAIILPPDYIAVIVSGTLTYIFFVPLYYMWFDSLKK